MPFTTQLCHHTVYLYVSFASRLLPESVADSTTLSWTYLCLCVSFQLTGAADRAVLKTEMSISTVEFDTYRQAAEYKRTLLLVTFTIFIAPLLKCTKVLTVGFF